MMVHHLHPFPHPVYFRVEEDYLARFQAAMLFPPLWVITFSLEAPPFDPITFIISHNPPGLAPQLTGANLHPWLHCCFLSVPTDMPLLTLLLFQMILPLDSPVVLMSLLSSQRHLPWWLHCKSQEPLELASRVFFFPGFVPGNFPTQHTYNLIYLRIVCLPS